MSNSNIEAILAEITTDIKYIKSSMTEIKTALAKIENKATLNEKNIAINFVKSNRAFITAILTVGATVVVAIIKFL